MGIKRFGRSINKGAIKSGTQLASHKVVQPGLKHPKRVTRPMGKVAKSSAKGIRNAGAFTVKSTKGIFKNGVGSVSKLLKSPVVFIGLLAVGGFGILAVTR